MGENASQPYDGVEDKDTIGLHCTFWDVDKESKKEKGKGEGLPISNFP